MEAQSKQKRKDAIHAFWRDEADLDLLNPLARWSWYLALPFISLAGLVTAILRFEALVNDDAFLLFALLAVLVYPVGLCLEMYFKGGSAGARLMREESRADAVNFRQRIRNKIKAIEGEIRSIENSGVLSRNAPRREASEQWKERIGKFIEGRTKPKLIEHFGAANEILQAEGIDPVPIDDIAKFRDYEHYGQLFGKVQELSDKLYQITLEY